MTKNALPPLVSVGIPTYNRANLLRRALQSVLRQDYTNLEIIVSDNCSPTNDTSEIVELCQRDDKRIKFYKQAQTIGAKANFIFVEQQAAGEYFIWLADDDEWVSDDFLSSLMKYANDYLLTFSSAVGIDGEKHIHINNCYEGCVSQEEYSLAFSANGAGYPFYGIYNRQKMVKADIKFEFPDWPYYGEGPFLHKVFLEGSTKYVPEAKMSFLCNSSMPADVNIQIDAFVNYVEEVVRYYSSIKLPGALKAKLLANIFRVYHHHLEFLLSRSNFEHQAEEIKNSSILSRAYGKDKNFFK